MYEHDRKTSLKNVPSTSRLILFYTTSKKRATGAHLNFFCYAILKYKLI